MEWINKIVNFFVSIGDFFVLVWNDEDRWWLIGGLLFLFIGFLLYVVFPLYHWIDNLRYGSCGTSSKTPKSNKVYTPPTPKSSKKTVIIKGVYQMNGPKPFSRTLSINPTDTGYYSQLMGNKSKQAQWIKAHFPGAETEKGFSMSVNIQ